MIGLQSFSERAAAVEDLQRRLRDGDPEAMRTLALRHLEAFEPAAGAREQGIALLTETAQRDDAEAQYLLGEILVFGRYGVTKDMERGAEWWRGAAKNGHLRATERIAYATATGNHGQQADYAQAKPWIEQLIGAYREGRLGASIDRVKARRWEDEFKFIERQYQRLGHEFLPLEPLRTQAATNDAQAQFQLAQQLFATSQIRNGKEAVGHYTQAARSGHVQAQMKLFQLYRRGLRFTSTANPSAGPQVIVAKDEHRAIAYLAQAADAHHPQAMAELALAHEKGRYGLTQDYLKAKSLYAQILEAAADNRYDWDVDERFLSMQRIRLQACTRILKAQAKH
jgi:TPR repeat protein